MKILSWILFALIVTMFWLIKFQWDLNLWPVNLIWYNQEVNIESESNIFWVSTDYIYYFPEKIFNINNWKLFFLIKDYSFLDHKIYFMIVIFIFYFILYEIWINFISLFPQKKDKVYLYLFFIPLYFLIIQILMYNLI